MYADFDKKLPLTLAKREQDYHVTLSEAKSLLYQCRDSSPLRGSE
jgi:hypothetical protein